MLRKHTTFFILSIAAAPLMSASTVAKPGFVRGHAILAARCALCKCDITMVWEV